MRKVLISFAAAASALAFATPAAAQYWPAPVPQGYGYGYQHNYGHARALQARVDHLQREIARLAQYRMITRAEYNGLRRDSRQVERSLRARAQYGLHPQEAYQIERRIARLEAKIHREVRDGRRGGYGYNPYGGHTGYGYVDRDRDGRDDRYEDDRGYYPG